MIARELVRPATRLFFFSVLIVVSCDFFLVGRGESACMEECVSGFLKGEERGNENGRRTRRRKKVPLCEKR